MATAVDVPTSGPPRPTAAAAERPRTARAVGACVVLAVLLRAPYLGIPLGRDEGGIAYIARNWPSGHGSLYGSYWLDRPPLLVAWFKVAVLGGDLGVRVLGALAAVALVVVVAALGRAVAGDGVGRIAGLLAALLTGSIAIDAVMTPGELLAAVPSALSVLCLVLAHGRRHVRFVLAAGVLAACAVLTKQSFLDAGVAGLAFVAVNAARDGALRVRWPLTYAAGAGIPLIALLVWQVAAQLPDGGFVYALAGFRIDALHALAGSSIPLQERITALGEPAVGSGLVVVVPATLAGLRLLRGDRVLLVTLGAWLASALVGVLGGGSYWPHYLIELVPVGCVGAAVLLASSPERVRVAILGAATALSLAAAIAGAIYVTQHPLRQPELAMARYVRGHAGPSDTQYVMYARANVAYYTGLPSPYPYQWSLMVRAVPGARERLQRLLASKRRPTWVVQWQHPGRWQLDPGRRTARLLRSGYRRAAVVCGHSVYLRNDRPVPAPVTPTPRGCATPPGLPTFGELIGR